jgi:hypothetical protein
MGVLQKQKRFSCMTARVMALSNVAFGDHDPQTSRYVTYVCGDFLKEESMVKT